MTVIVAIGGGSAAGKTTLARRIAAQSSYVTHVSMDDFYANCSNLTDEEMVERNFDNPKWLRWQRLDAFLQSITSEKSRVTKPTYEFGSGNTSTERIAVTPIVVIEGLWALDERVAEYADICVYVEADADTRLMRRVERDTEERGVSPMEVVRDFKEHVKPMHEAHVEPTKKRADIIVNGGIQTVAVDAILGAAKRHQ